jgi:RNA polymerase sigma factor (sigma-70 family)
MAGEGSGGWGEEALASSDRFEALADPRSGEEESRMQVRELIESLLEELDPEDRRVLVLRYFRGWTMGRIGQLMRISESRVCRIHASILERLKRRLESRRLEILA